MKMKIKILLCGLLILLLASTGCTNNPAETPEDTPQRTAETQPPPPPPAESTPAGADIPESDFCFSEGLDENGFWMNINVLDYVELFNYQAMPIPAEVHTITQQDVQEIVDSILSDHSVPQQVYDRPVEFGDTINIDFVGSIDGAEFEGGSTGGRGMHVTIGVTEFIGDFLEQLMGHLPGTVVNVEVPFPDDYWEPSLAGYDALFVTTINYIAGDNVLPELTDEFVAQTFFFLNISTVDELYHEIEVSLRNNAVQQYIFEYVTTQVVVNYIPDKVLRHYQRLLMQEFMNEAMQSGMELEDMLAWFGYEGKEDLLDAHREGIETDAKMSLIMQAIAVDAGIVATVQDVTDFFVEEFGTDDFSMFEEIYGLPWLKQFIRTQMIIEFITERVVLS